MSERTRFYTNKGSRSQLLAIAPETDFSPSKRYNIIEEEDQNLNRNIGDLQEGTKARNRVFQKRIDNIWDDTEIWEAKLKTEAREAVETITNMRDEYQLHMDEFTAQLQSEIKTVFDNIDNKLVVDQQERLQKVGDKLSHFVTKTAPAGIDNTSGEVRRGLKKQIETFSIGQQKERIREQKFVNNASSHIQKTAQQFTDEKALTMSCFANLEDDVVQHERRAVRMHFYRWNKSCDKVTELTSSIKIENDTRVAEDVILLDTIIDTQQLLQQTVLEHFGQEDLTDKDDGKTYPVTQKLNDRMDKIESKKKLDKE